MPFLGLLEEPTLQDIFVGLLLVAGAGLAVSIGEFLMSRFNPQKNYTVRFFIYAGLMGIGRALWWITFDKSYFPESEVVTAVVPALAHPYLFPWQAPYGMLWYWMNQAIVFFAYPLFWWLEHGVRWMMGMAVVDTLVLFVFRKSELLTVYWMTSLFIWSTIPWNLPVLWLVILGFYSRLTLPLSIIAKLPVGAPWIVWLYDFGQCGASSTGFCNAGSALVPGHWMPYAVLAAWWLGALLSHFKTYDWMKPQAYAVRNYE